MLRGHLPSSSVRRRPQLAGLRLRARRTEKASSYQRPAALAAPRGETGRLQVPAPLLLPLEGHEQGLEVADPEAAAAVALDDLEEHGRAVLQRVGEDLQ